MMKPDPRITAVQASDAFHHVRRQLDDTDDAHAAAKAKVTLTKIAYERARADFLEAALHRDSAVNVYNDAFDVAWEALDSIGSHLVGFHSGSGSGNGDDRFIYEEGAPDRTPYMRRKAARR